MSKLSWKPIRKGRIYCASACGLGCTWAEYQKAKKAGEALAAKLGEGRSVDLHENLGWFVSVSKGEFSVRINEPTRSLSVFLNPKRKCGGIMNFVVHASPSRAKKGLRDALNLAKERLHNLELTVAEAEAALR